MIGFYVSILRGEKRGFLAGPFDSKEEADAMVWAASNVAADVDPRAWFDAFGVARLERDGPLPKGVIHDAVMAWRGQGVDPAPLAA